MNFINLTPHDLNIVGDDGVVVDIPKTGDVARVNVDRVKVGSVNGIDLFNSVYGDVVGLPDPVAGTIYVVSGLVRSAAAGRTDVASPGALVRDADGRPVGARGLDLNS